MLRSAIRGEMLSNGTDFPDCAAQHTGYILNLPVYLDAEVQAYLAEIASRKGVPVSDLANDLLKREIAIIEAVK